MSDLQTARDENSRYLLTVSIVTYRPNVDELKATLESLANALTMLDRNLVKIFIIQNSNTPALTAIVAQTLDGYAVELQTGQGNIGFGKAHNLVLPETGLFHLILNPDIEMDGAALTNALDFMRDHEACGLLSPAARWPDGKRQYLCKRYPALFDLLLRGFAPGFVKKWFCKRLTRYEMQLETNKEIFWDPPIVSGCFMFFRGRILRQLGGFEPRFFLYFEDFDLALRASQITRVAYVPSVTMIHMGGHAAKKGLLHIRLFLKSALLFYQLHGLKLF